MSSGRTRDKENRFREVAPDAASRSISVAREASCRGSSFHFLLNVGAFMIGASILGCAAPTQHTPEPYRSDETLAAALSDRAHRACEAANPNEGVMPIRPFVTDGCSRFPDTEWNLDCCVEHDLAYWCGGDAERRLLADEEFGRCVASRSNAFLGWVMKSGVRMGGHPFFPTNYRWGYGHAYRASYPSAIPPR